MTLRAIVIGSGWAGEGHIWGLQAAGVEVVALGGRNPESVKALASRFGIKAVSLDWPGLLVEFCPDIVSIATPAAPHRQLAVAAAEAGCHVVCEKPLAVTAAEAREMFETARRAGVKTAYAATGCYTASYLYLRELITSGLIGEVREIEYHTSPFSLTLLYSWACQLKLGGGLLNNVFTHHLQQVLFTTGGRIVSAMGTTSNYRKRAPLLPGPPPTDFRQTIMAKLTPEQEAVAEWRPVDIDFGYKVLVQLQMPKGQIATALLTSIEGANKIHPTHLAFHGERGTLYLINPDHNFTIQHFDAEAGSWNELKIPQTIMDALPQIEDRVQQQWHQFFKEFVADVSGAGYSGYPTFRDGWEAVEVMEIVRGGKSWTSLPQL